MNEDRVDALEAEVASLRAAVGALVVLMHEMEVAPADKTARVAELVRYGLPGLFDPAMPE